MTEYSVEKLPAPKISRSDFESLMTALEVKFVKLSECLVSPGWRMASRGVDAPGIHYNVDGVGHLIVADRAPIELHPHTLVILPPNTPFVLEGTVDPVGQCGWRTIQGVATNISPGVVPKFVAGDSEPRLMLVCGYFRALYGSSVDLFGSLNFPIIEQFSPSDQVDQNLKAATTELARQEVGVGTVTAALLKVVLMQLLRRSLVSQDVWNERFAVLGDPQIARAFADMAARPSAPHTIQSLSQSIGLSRSAFIARFAVAFGQSPMGVLRQLRMRQAATLLSTNILSVDQVALSVGYQSRSSFSRAFRKVHGLDPTEYRLAAQVRPQ